MKKILFPIAIVATLFVAGCAKENLVEPMGPQNGVTILTAGTPTTKTVLQNDQKVLWTNGDQINVNGVESEALVLDTPAATATFTIPGVLNNPFKAVFPASIYKDAQTVTLPAVQAYAEGSFGPNVSPMAAYQANGNNLNFKHLAAVIKLNITKGSDADEIMYVEFCGKNNEQVCGDFSIDFENATLAGVSTKASDKKVRCNIYEEISSAGLSVYVAVPAVEYQNGYTVKVVDTKGHFMEISKQSGETLVAGKIYDMPAFEFAPTGTEFNVGITTAQEFIDYCKSGDHSSTSVAAILNDIEFTASDCAAFQSIGTLSGTIKGNHYTISGFNTGKPIVSSAAATAMIENLTVSGNAILSTIPSSGAENSFGTFYSYSNGATLINCHSAVDYTFGAMTWSRNTQLKIGGLVGDNRGVVKECVNSGDLSFTSDFDLSGFSNKNNLRIGGIVALNYGSAANVEKSSTSGLLSFLGALKGQTLNLGGIAGENNSSSKLNSCVNGAEVTFACPSTTTTINVGGVVGKNVASLQACVNESPVALESSATTTAIIRVGGCVGLNQTAIEGNGQLQNEGEVKWNATAGWTSTTESPAAIGGVIGTTEANITGCVNIANVSFNEATVDAAGKYSSIGGVVGYVNSANAITVSNCANSGRVDFNVTKAEGDKAGSRQYVGIALGGIVGRNSGSQLTLDNCDNNGIVDGGFRDFNNNLSTCYYGGVIGYLKGAASSITNCDVTSAVSNRTYNNSYDNLNNAVYCGGIVAYSEGTEANPLSITNCTVKKLDGGSVSVQSVRGRTAGIAAYAKYVVVTKCDCNLASDFAHQCYGGICAQMINSKAIECNVMVAHHSTFSHYAGGFVGDLGASSLIDNCTFRGTLSCESGNGNKLQGLLAGYVSANGSEIKNCKYSGTSINKYAGTESTAEIGKVKDGITVTLTNNTALSE